MTFRPTVVVDTLPPSLAAALPRGQFVCVAGQVGRVVGILDGAACWTDGVDPRSFRGAVRAFRWRVAIGLLRSLALLPILRPARFAVRFDQPASSLRRAALAYVLAGATLCLCAAFRSLPSLTLLGAAVWLLGAWRYRRAAKRPPIFDLSFARIPRAKDDQMEEGAGAYSE